MQPNVLTAYRVSVAFHADDGIRLDCHEKRRTSTAALCGQRAKQRDFLNEPLSALSVAAVSALTHKHHIFLCADKVPTAAQSQQLVKHVLEVPMGRLDVAILMRLACVDAMPLGSVVSKQVAILPGEFLVAGKVIHRG